MNKAVGVAIAALVLIVALSLLRWNTDQSDTENPAARADVTTPVSVAVAAAEEPGIVKHPLAEDPLPPAELPFAAFIDELEQRSLRGEASATCRLAAEHTRCGYLASQKASLDRWMSERQREIEQLPAEEQEMESARATRDLSRRESFIEEMEPHCEGVKSISASSLANLWRQAALAGNPAAMKQYASGNAFRLDKMMDVLPELDRYRREAESIATAAAKRGDFDIWLSLAASYSNSSGTRVKTLLAQAVTPDTARAVALYRKAKLALDSAGHEEAPITQQIQARLHDLEAFASDEDLRRADQITLELQAWDAPEIRGVGRLDTAGRAPSIDRGWCGR